MSEMDIHRAQILRQQIARVLKGKHITDSVGALEMVVVDVLSALPGMDQAMLLSSFEAMASDVRFIIKERYRAKGRAH